MANAGGNGIEGRAGAPLLGLDEVHVRLLRADGEAPGGEAARALLAPDEIDRAERFATARLTARFIAARAFLRLVLAPYAGAEAAALQFALEPGGKPRLAAGGPLRFNLSHSGDVVLVAVARDRDVGVDVERIEVRRDVDALATVLSADEQRELAAFSGEDRRAAFFRCWARKEAWLKGVGTGLRIPTRSFTVGAGMDPGPRRVEAPASPSGPGSEAALLWTVVDLDCGPGYAGAVAAQGTGWRVRAFDQGSNVSGSHASPSSSGGAM